MKQLGTWAPSVSRKVLCLIPPSPLSLHTSYTPHSLFHGARHLSPWKPPRFPVEHVLSVSVKSSAATPTVILFHGFECKSPFLAISRAFEKSQRFWLGWVMRRERRRAQWFAPSSSLRLNPISLTLEIKVLALPRKWRENCVPQNWT